MTHFRNEYYRQKPEFIRQARQAVRSAEANLNAMDASFDDLREFVGLKSMVASPVTFMSSDDAWAKYWPCVMACENDECLSNCGLQYFEDIRTPNLSLQSQADYDYLNTIFEEYSNLLDCYAKATTLQGLAVCDKLADDFTTKYGSLSLASPVAPLMSKQALNLQSWTMDDLIQEYADLVQCYANAKTLSQTMKCDRDAQAFTKKYGSLSLAYQRMSYYPAQSQSFDRKQMIRDYDSLVMCYSNAGFNWNKIMICESQAADFVDKYGEENLPKMGGLSLAAMLPQSVATSSNLSMIILSAVLLSVALGGAAFLYKRAKNQSQKGQVYKKLDVKKEIKSKILPSVDEEVAIATN